MYRGVFSPAMLLFAYNLNFYVSKMRKTVTVDVFLMLGQCQTGEIGISCFCIFMQETA